MGLTGNLYLGWNMSGTSLLDSLTVTGKLTGCTDAIPPYFLANGNSFWGIRSDWVVIMVTANYTVAGEVFLSSCCTWTDASSFPVRALAPKQTVRHGSSTKLSLKHHGQYLSTSLGAYISKNPSIFLSKAFLSNNESQTELLLLIRCIFREWEEPTVNL